jgi:hypothetical protein
VSPAHSAALAELGAELDVDIYALREERAEDGSDRLLTRSELAHLGGALLPKP